MVTRQAPQLPVAITRRSTLPRPNRLSYTVCVESQISTQSSLARIGAISAPLGAVVLLVATMVHPMGADPNDASAAFAEYAADPSWVWSHLGQFAGVAVLGMALIGLAATFEAGRAAAWSRIGVAGTAATIAMAAALQAVDGAALKVTVDRWSAATAESRDTQLRSGVCSTSDRDRSCRSPQRAVRLHVGCVQHRDAAEHPLSRMARCWRLGGRSGDGARRCRDGICRLCTCRHDAQHASEPPVCHLDHCRCHSHVAVGPTVERYGTGGRSAMTFLWRPDSGARTATVGIWSVRQKLRRRQSRGYHRLSIT